MVGMFPAIVGTYSIRESAEQHAELLRKHDVEAVVTPSPDGRSWVVLVSAAQYPLAARLTEAARLTGELNSS